MTGRHECLLRRATTSLNEELQRVEQSVLDRVNAAQLRIAEQRRDLADLRHSLTDTEARVTRLQQSFHALSDHFAELRCQAEVDHYLERMIDRLIQYGRSMRLVVCYVDPASTNDPQLLHRSAESSQSGQQPPVT